jgi:membrane protein implicated in regulation of membrane protease activity
VWHCICNATTAQAIRSSLHILALAASKVSCTVPCLGVLCGLCCAVLLCSAMLLCAALCVLWCAMMLCAVRCVLCSAMLLCAALCVLCCAMMLCAVLCAVQWVRLARGPPRGLHSHGHHRTLQAHEGLQRAAPHGMGRFRPACGAICTAGDCWQFTRTKYCSSVLTCQRSNMHCR